MRVPGSERRPRNSDAAIFLLMLLLPLPLPLPSAARALSPSSAASTPPQPPPVHHPPPPTPQPYRKAGGGQQSSSTSTTSSSSFPQRVLSARVVQTQQGTLRGIVLELRGLGNRAAFPTSTSGRGESRTHQQQQQQGAPHLNAVEAFWGIRYAAPPVGDLRFAPPKPPDKWEGVKVADSFAPVCPQKFPVDFANRTAALAVMPRGRYLRLRRTLPLLANQSEDCLFLNLYVPGGGSPAKKSSPYAVMFYVHGESYEWNSGNPYDGSILASLGNVIVVTINFRLGALGFMQTGPSRIEAPNDPTQINGNWGLLDVLEALRWVRKNVEAFGGNKERVTVIGHHTGAALVHLLLMSTAAKGLFHRAVMLSGSAHSLWAIVREPRSLRRKVAERLGCLHPTHPIPSATIQEPTPAEPFDPTFPVTPPPVPEGEDVDITPCLRRATTAALLASYPPSLRFLARFGPSLREDDIGPWLEDSTERFPSGGGGSFARTPLVLGAATAEAYSELSAEDIRWGLEEERRDALLRTFVANSFYFHRREILAAVKNEYADWVGLGSDPRARTARNAEAKFGDGPPTSSPTKASSGFVSAPTRHHQHPITVRDATVEALGDGQTVAPLVSVTRTHAGSKGAPTYFLHFSHHARDGVDYAQERLGSAPEEIISHLFGVAVLGGLSPVLLRISTAPPEVPLNYTRQDVSVALAMIRYFANFANTGDPNWESQAKKYAARGQPWPSGRTEQSGHLPTWVPFDLTSQMHLNMGPKAKMRSHYRSHKMALWLNLIPQLHRSQDEDDTSPHHEFLEKESHYFAGAIMNKSIIHPYWRLGAMWSKSVTHTAIPPLDCDPIGSQNGDSISSSSFSNPSSPPKLFANPRNASSASEDGATDEEGGEGSEGRGGRNGMGEEEESDEGGNYLAALSITVTLGVVLLLLNAAVLVAGVLHHYRQRDKKTRSKGKKKSKGCGGGEDVLNHSSEQDSDGGGHIRFGEFLDSVSDSKSNKDFGEVGTELGLVGLLPRTYPDVMGHDHRTFKSDSTKCGAEKCATSSEVKKHPPLDLPSSFGGGDKDAPVGVLYAPDTSSLSRKRHASGSGTIPKAKATASKEPFSTATVGVKKRVQIQEISV